MLSFTTALLGLMFQTAAIEKQSADGFNFPKRGEFETYYQRISSGMPAKPGEKERLKLFFERIWYCQDEHKEASEGIKNPIAKDDPRLGKSEEVELICLAYSLGGIDATRVFRRLQLKSFGLSDEDVENIVDK